MSKLIKEMEEYIKSVKGDAYASKYEDTDPDWSAEEVVDLLQYLKKLAEKELLAPVKLPKFVVEIIEQAKKDGNTLYDCFYALHSSLLPNKKREWMYDNADNEGKVAQAWLTDNYEEEKEKEQLYVVKIPYKKQMFYKLDKDNQVEISFWYENAGRFTSEEVEQYFPEIKQFAEKVEEAE